MDRIVVLDAGRIAEEAPTRSCWTGAAGTPSCGARSTEELLQRRGWDAEPWRRQRGQLPSRRIRR
ncbi:hypothetical protein ACQP00_26805 [Dactylosporangium sp. CS-047395]|uniref:hypothetical protein n=1 Tax=Dactylosporangium sp. CS-047395 TaxID=3239936 RepID=UPI003D9007AD